MILKVPEDAPCEVFDALGRKLEYATWADTETGEAVHLVRDDGRFVQTLNEEGEITFKTEWREHPAPLTAVRG
jgi:hypothetical protein